MKRKSRWIAGGTLALALVGGGTAIAFATGAVDDDRALTGSRLQRATAAALAHTGEGTVIEAEVGDDGAAYGVELRRKDGTVVEVNLDENFAVIGQSADEDGPSDD